MEHTSTGLHSSVKEASLRASNCPGSLRKVSCKIVGKYCCFKYQELILTHRHHNLFTALKMCYKVLHFVSSALVSTALFSFSCRAPCWLLLHNSYQLDSCTKSLEFSLLALLRTLSPFSRLLQISFSTLLFRLSAFSKPAEISLQSMRS